MPSLSTHPYPRMAGVGRRRGGEREASDVLPSELWSEILLRLPVRTLLSLKCVSKTFLSLIQNPNFASLHFSRFNNDHNNCASDLILLERQIAKSNDDFPIFQYDDYFLVRRSYTTPTITTEFRFPVHCGTYCGVIGSLDGLFLLLKNTPSSSCMILCNPSIGKSLIIPPSPFSHLGEAHLGFGYDPVTNDYKVVSIVYVKADSLNPDCESEDDSLNPDSESEDDSLNPDSESEDDSFNRESKFECELEAPSGPLVEVYSLREASWRTIGSHVMCPDWFVESCIYANGALHWLAGLDEYYFGRYDYYLTHVVSFHLGSEIFSYTELPNMLIDDDGLLSDDYKDDVKLLVLFHGSPAVFCLTARDISLWVVRESNWTTEWRMEWEPKLHRFLHDQIRGTWSAIFSGESSELLVGGYFGVVSYNIKTQQFRYLDRSVTYVGKYVDSLLWRESLFALDPIQVSEE